MASPGSFTSGSVLTAAEMNALPAGLVAVQKITTSFATSSTHTTYQDTGATLTFDEVSGRVYRHSVRFNPYPNGGLQQINFRLLRNGVTVSESAISSVVLNQFVSYPFCLDFWYESPASGSVTWKWQMQAGALNTAVSDFANATTPRQYAVEDVSA